MHVVTYEELLAVADLTPKRLKMYRFRDQVALAFGQSDCYESLRYIELDAAAVRLTDVLSEQLERKLAVAIVRDQWGIWQRVLAMAEAANAANVPNPVLFYVCRFEDLNGRVGHVTLGSLLDSRDDNNLRLIAQDLRARTGVVPRSFAAVEMRSILDDVRRAAKRAGYDWSDPFLPPFGDPRLDELLQPYDELSPDRAVVVVKNKVRAAATQAGAKARSAFEHQFSSTLQ
jgi:hypothetical protein